MVLPLHVPSLAIEGFRGIPSLDLPRLGRVTLLAGENGVGKTTVLEAVRMYASRAHTGALFEILDTREEYRPGDDEIVHVDFSSLFHDDGRLQEPKPIRICAGEEALILDLVDPEPDAGNGQGSTFEGSKVLSLQIGEHCIKVPGISYMEYEQWKRPTRLGREAIRRSDTWPTAIQIETLGPGLLANSDLAGFWDMVALTDGEELAVEALRIVLGDDVERLAVVGDGKPHVGFRSRERRVLVKLRSSGDPVPLKRLGDGANRLLAIALALANCRNGILLIDEAENGIHYSVQTDMWRMVFGAATRANVQVVATTHSWDCIAGFAAAAVGSDAEGILYRLEDIDGQLHAVRYPEEELEVAARQRIEVR